MPAAETVRAPLGRLWDRAAARPELVWLGAIVAVAAAVRFSTLGLQSFDSGETITAARVLHSSYGATFDAYSTIERSGPLYYTLAWSWSHLFGIGEVALRSLSAIFGTATVVIVYAAARELLSRRTALIAAALAAVGPDLVWYSQEARSYALFIMLAAAAVYFFVRALNRPSRGALAGWALCSALALCTHYFAIFSIGPEAAWLILASRGRRAQSLAAVGGVAAAGLALLPLAIHQEGTGRGNGFTSVPVLERAATGLVKFMAGEGSSTSGEWSATSLESRIVGLVAIAVCAAAIAALIRRGRPRERAAAATIGAIAALSFAVPVLLALAGFDFLEPRNLLGSLVPLMIVVAIGLDVAIRTLGRRPAPAGARLAPMAAAVGLSLAMLIATIASPHLQRDDWRGLSRLIAANGRVGVIMTQPPSAGKPLRYYFGHPLTPLGEAEFPCGVRARTIVTLSRNEPPALASSGFHLVAVTETAQGWRVATYRARAPRRIDAEELRILDILKGNEAPRVDAAPAVAPQSLPGALAAGAGAGGPSGRPAGEVPSCAGPGVAIRLDRS